MSELYLFSDSSGSRKSSVAESVSSNPEFQNSTFPLSPKRRPRNTHRRLDSDGVAISPLHYYFPQLPANQPGRHQSIKTGDDHKSLVGNLLGRIHFRRIDWRANRALIPWLVVAGIIVVYLSSSPSTPVPPSTHSNPSVDLPKLTSNNAHPLKQIIKEAQASWKNMEERRSKTYQQAVAEYKRRYNLEPPDGFQKWFAFAQGHGHRPIDEYGSMMEQLSRFRRMDANELRFRTNSIGEAAGFGLIRMQDGKLDIQVSGNLSYSTYTNNDHDNYEFKLKDGRIYNRWATSDRPLYKSIRQTQTWALSKVIERVIRYDPSLFRNMKLAINEHFEPRVIIPWEDSVKEGSDTIEIYDEDTYRGEEDVWSTFQKSCPPDSKARNWMRNQFGSDDFNLPDQTKKTSEAIQPDHLEFATQSPVAIQDIYCNYPERHSEQGLFFSNTSKLLGLYPVFSQSTAQGFGDIVIPSYLYIQDPYKTRQYANEPLSKGSRGTSPYIAESEKSHFIPSQWKEWNVRWEDKKDQVYWRGLLRDGGDNPSGFQSNFGRHRMVKRFGSSILGHLETIVWDLKPLRKSFLGLIMSQDKLIIEEGVERSQLNQKSMDVAYLAEEHCGASESCQEVLRGNYRLKMWEPFGVVKFFKWSLDLDGIGFSARFLNLLQVGTVVLKQTIYREFYSDWLVPWVHYIPLSTKGAELYNIWNYFLGRDKTRRMSKDHSRWEVTNHEEMLKQIASHALDWSQSHSREIDLEIYSYRLLIEWNRIWNSSE